MKKYLLLSVLAAIFGFVATSCLGEVENPEYVTQQNFADCYAIAYDNQSNSSYTVTAPVTVYLRVNMTTQLCSVSISGLKNSDGTVMPQFSMVDMKWSTDETQMWGYVNVINPKVTASAGTAPAVSSMEFRWTNRVAMSKALNMTDLSICNFNFVINNQLVVTGGCRTVIIAAETTSTTEGADPFVSLKPYYKITPDFAKKTATVNIYSAQFADRMPALNMDFANIPMTIDDAGNLNISAANLTPSIAGTPYPQFPISNLTLNYSPANSTNILKFDCMVMGKPYSVKAKMSFDAVPEI